jgi:hypothetical protein
MNTFVCKSTQKRHKETIPLPIPNIIPYELLSINEIAIFIFYG